MNNKIIKIPTSINYNSKNNKGFIIFEYDKDYGLEISLQIESKKGIRTSNFSTYNEIKNIKKELNNLKNFLINIIKNYQGNENYSNGIFSVKKRKDNKIGTFGCNCLGGMGIIEHHFILIKDKENIMFNFCFNSNKLKDAILLGNKQIKNLLKFL